MAKAKTARSAVPQRRKKKEPLMAHEQAFKNNPLAKAIGEAVKIVDGPFKKRKMDMLLAYNPADNSIDGDGDRDKEVALTVLITNKRNSELPPGIVEYGVCDGLPGERDTSLDFYDLAEALDMFNFIAKKGWSAYRKQCERRAKRMGWTN